MLPANDNASPHPFRTGHVSGASSHCLHHRLKYEDAMPIDDRNARSGALRGHLVCGASLCLFVFGCNSSDNTATPEGGTDATASDSSSIEAAALDSSHPDGSQPGHDAGSDVMAGGDTGVSPDAEAGAVANVVISDQYNNRVIEVDPQGHIVWTFGDGKATPGPTSVVAPNDSERLRDGRTLIAGTGTPVGAGDPACDAVMDAGTCTDNRVLIVAADGGIAWQYGDDGGLNTPVCSVMLPNGNVLITDQGNARVIEVTPQKTIAWEYAPILADGGNLLNNPNSAERVDGGHTLIADENNNRVLEVDDAGAIVWQYSQTPDAGALNGVAFASRLPNGNTLITDANNNRVVEVTAQGNVAWVYYTASRRTSGPVPTVDGGNASPIPTRAVRLASGNTLISDQFNHQVIEVDSAGHVVFSYGQLNVAGNGAGQLNGPYDAKRVGDFTGLTPPP
jgi:hypothetical protein